MAGPDLARYRTKLGDYAGKYETIRMRREDGILEMVLHTNGGSLRWSRHAHAELEEAFLNIGRDRENKVVVMTGTGDEFSGPVPNPADNKARHTKTTDEIVDLQWEVRNLLTNLLAIEVPMIGVVNGPAARHAELPILCDIVLAAETASFQDSAHFVGGLVPGDGMHVVMPIVMGLNRARYFLLTGQVIGAREAKEIGFVNEVCPNAKLQARAWELARQVAQQPELVRRFTRNLLTEKLRRQIAESVPYSIALEGLGMTGA
jgi:enoyl-CoA hydratase/carnithine racemase